MKTTSLQTYLEGLHQTFQTLDDGNLADYIPELTKADPNWFGIAIVTVDGNVYQVGDTREEFTIQSISKAFTYGLALEDQGIAQVLGKIDVEPSGEAFNSISLEPDTGRPRNPMINAGAIVATSLVKDDQNGGRLNRILKRFEQFCGRPLSVDESVYASESSTGHRNRAISHLLRNYEILEGDPEPVLDSYFKQCSILVNCRDLAVMGATLANDGVNPITGIRALEAEQVPRVLSVMATCGMYDYSGNWTYSVGMPAKSGVGGGVVAVLPGQLGLAVFSPRLDVKGNSVRGIAVCEALSRDFGLHMLRTTRMTNHSVIRNQYNLAQVRSKLQRPLPHQRVLDLDGAKVGVFELTGELMFVSADIVCAQVYAEIEQRSHTIIDLRRVESVDQSATLMLTELAESLCKQGHTLLITGYAKLYGFMRQFKRQINHGDVVQFLAHRDLDQALEWCESELIAKSPAGAEVVDPVAFRDQPLCEGLGDDEFGFLESLLTRHRFAPGDAICKEGDPADQLYFVASGQVSTWIRISPQEHHRLFAACPGWSFGESALFGEGRKRSADVLADSDVELLALEPRALEQHPDPRAQRVLLTMFRNLSEINMERLKQANGEIRMLGR